MRMFFICIRMHAHACMRASYVQSTGRQTCLPTYLYPSIHPSMQAKVHTCKHVYMLHFHAHIIHGIYATSPRTTTVRRHDTVTNPPAFRLLVYDPRLALLTLGFEVPKGEHIRQPPSLSIPCDPSCRYSEG